MDELAVTDLQATCSSLGYNDGVGAYQPDIDCVECVKDLIRFIRRDDANHEVRRSLGDLAVVKSDLVPILRDHSNNRELFDVTLRLLVNLTNPELLLFKEELPEDKETRNYYLQIQTHRQSYKEAFIDQQLWTVLANTLTALLKKDWDERLEDDKLIIERVLILIRNVLQVPTNVRREGRTEDDATVHDQILWVLHKSGMQDLLLYIAGSEQEEHYCLHVLEIISLIFREQDPTSLATANLGRSKAEKQADEEALAKAVKLEAEKQKAKAKAKNFSRHSRFGGTYVLKDVKSISERALIVQKPLTTVNQINFDKEKRGVKKSKNRMAPENADMVRRSTLPVRLFLKEFCTEFLHSAYNHIMNVVKDALNRQKAQMNDETYFLWAMRFFMQFNRGHNMKVELVSETLSRQTFHFLQQQIDNYRDNFEHEKKNRPKYLMWGRRMHLCIRAYQELLYNLVDMEASDNNDIREAGRVLRASVFYEPEYRELCLQQLSSYNPDKMTLGYLTDLVSTTHVFLKLMEQMSKNKHMIVSKKTKKRMKKSSNKPKPGGGQSGQSREDVEAVWEAISSPLTALLQGRAELPTDVLPFDAASEQSLEEQKVTCMQNIQRALRDREPGRAVALMRAAREVWPEGDSFGEAGAEEEEEFMALREVLFADLGVDYSGAPTESGEIGEEEEEDDEEEDEEDNVKVLSVEQEFSMKALVFRFAVKNVTMPYGVLFNNYLRNSKETNHHIVRMFHRIAVECDLPALLFQASIFRVFQLIWRDLKSNPSDTSLRELAKFGKFIVSKFMNVATQNKKVFMELFFWKTSREATEIVEGYGTQTNSAKAKASFWSSEEEERLSTVFGQVMEMERSGDNSDRQGDILDQIELIFSCENRSRRQIGNKLRELGLIQNMREITKKPLKSSRAWQDEELEKLRELFDEFKEAENPAARITEQWKAANMPPRSKNKLCDKILELGWVDDRSKLGKVKKRNRRPKEGEAGFLDSKSDSDSALDSSSEGEEESDSDEEDEHVEPSNKLGLREVLEKVVDQSKTLLWLADTLKDEADDREEEFDGEDVPLVTVDQEIQSALAEKTVTDLLSSLGLCSPSQGEQFWRIAGNLTVAQLTERSKLLTSVANGADIGETFENADKSLLAVERGFQAIKKTKKKKKEKRGPNKWQPFRRTDEPEPEKPTKAKTPKRTNKSRNRSFLDSSDDEAPKETVDDLENAENVDPENKAKVPSKQVDKNPFAKLKELNVDRIKKLLDDDSFTGSEDSDVDTAAAPTKSSGESEGKPQKKKNSAAKKQAPKKSTRSKQKVEKSANSSSDEDEEKTVQRKSKTKKKQAPKKSAKSKKKDEANISSDEKEEEVVEKKTVTEKKSKKKPSITSSSDEGVMDPTQPSVDPIRAAPSGEDSSVSMERNSLVISSDEESERENNKKSKSGENRRLVVSSSDEELVIPKKHSKGSTALDSDDDQVKSRSSSVSSLDDSRAKSPTQWVLTPLKGSELDDSKASLDDSRAKSPTQWVLTPKKGSQNNDSIVSNSTLDSTNRSPLSSPLSSRSLSPLTPQTKSTPANKRLRDTPGMSETASKKSRHHSPDKSLQLLLSDSSELPGDGDSPVKRTRAKKVVIDSDSE